MSIPMINYPAFRPYTNITPFTVRDGATYLLQIETLLGWIRNDLVPHIDKEIKELTENWDSTAVELISTWEQMSADLIARVELAESNLGDAVDEAEAAKVAAEAARDLAAMYASTVEAVQDAAVTLLVGDSESDIRTLLDSLYANSADMADVLDRVAAAESDISSIVDSAIPSAIAALDPLAKNPITGVVYARRFGLDEGNSAEDNTAAINAALAAVEPGGTIVIEAGEFLLNPFTMDKSISLIGTGSPGESLATPYKHARWNDETHTGLRGTILRIYNTTGSAIKIPGVDGALSGTVIENISLIGAGNDDATGISSGEIAGPGFPVRLRFRNVYIANFGTGFWSSAENSQFDSLFVTSCRIGISTGFPFNGNTFNAINIERCTHRALVMDDSDNNIFNGGVIQGNMGNRVIEITGGSSQAIFNGLYLENFGDEVMVWEVYISAGSRIRFNWCRFASPRPINNGIYLGTQAVYNEFDIVNLPDKTIVQLEGNNNRINASQPLMPLTGSNVRRNSVSVAGFPGVVQKHVLDITSSGTVSYLLPDYTVRAKVADVVINLPNPATTMSTIGKVYRIIATADGATVRATGGANVLGALTHVMPAWETLNVAHDGVEWLPV